MPHQVPVEVLPATPSRPFGRRLQEGPERQRPWPEDPDPQFERPRNNGEAQANGV